MNNLPGAGPGRPKGSQNKTTKLLKDAILMAAERAGGPDGMVGYLTAQATKNPQSFLPLLGKVLPLQISNDPDNPIGPTEIIIKAAVVSAESDDQPPA